MNKLRNKIKKVLNKDVTSFLNKYKIPLISILVVVLLACIGLIVTYAFYQVVDTKPVIGGSTTNIADIDVRVMAEERDSNGNGLNSYGIYPYIPRAGYKYNDTKSYCTNNSAINFNTNTYEANITAYEHDVCYLYFDSIASLDITLNVYAENVDSDGIGNGEYTKLETTALPTVGYEMNSSRSSCENGSTITYDSKENLFSVETSQKDVCNVYMDALDVDIALKIYVQTKKNSTNYYETKKIPENNFYVLGTKSACTGSSTMSIKNQKVVIAATGKTNCVAYLDVGTGPIPESMKTIVNGQNITITFGNSNLGTTPTTYYYSSDNGKTYTSSTSNTYTFTGLTPFTSYTFKAYSVDASGNSSRILTTNAEITYVYEKLFSYANQIQTVTIEVEGYYKLETWGAQGGSYSSYIGGYGGYSSGVVYLNANQQLYIAVGGSGATGCNVQYCSGGYNGGGRGAGSSRPAVYSGGGGGATHIATKTGILSTLSGSVDNILIVAGGGGGVSYQAPSYTGNGGAGGGASGTNGTNLASGYLYGSGGSQSSGGASGGGTVGSVARGSKGSFGKGGDGNYYSAGGGGGLYGGGASNQAGAGGGSGYIGNSSLVNKSMYCYNCTANSTEEAKTFPTTCHSANATENCAKEGTGYAKITYLGTKI